MRVASVGHAVFAVVMIALGVMGFASGDFGAIWQPGLKVVPARELLVYLCAAISLACGIGLLWRRPAAHAARVLLVWLLLWMLAFKLPVIVRAPLSEGSWENWAETAVIVAGSWVLYAWCADAWDKRHLHFATDNCGVRIARVFYGLAMIAFGLAHFFYLDQTAPLVPGWLPWHVAWAYGFGVTYIAAGVAVLGGVVARLAAALSTVQMGLFTLLVWLPVVVTGHAHAFEWNELGISIALTAAGWVVADSYRDVPWFAAGAR